jgi:hypothetical protein
MTEDDNTALQLMALINAARGVADMRSPSIPEILMKHGFKWEADKIQQLNDAVEAARKTA